MIKTKWILSVEDPSGETREVEWAAAEPQQLMGRANDSTLLLRDPTVPPSTALLTRTEDGVWLRVVDPQAPVRLGDLAVREAQLPPGVPLYVGESVIRLQPARSSGPALPNQPPSTRPWLTQAESGRRTLWMVKKAAATPLSLYLAGETGTGKEVLAHLVHAWSDRAAGPFVPLHCGALPLSLAESELFGHVKGAYTGAHQHRPGALMQAHNGTLFLDEVGDLPLDIQVKLLRFLENGEIRAVGSDRTTKADVRLVCATHHHLKDLVESGKFRRDLYYRLASVTVEIPTLRSRPEDIALLANRFAADLGRSLSPRALLRLQAHAWPGNVRELRHAVERACGLAGAFNELLGEDCFEFLLNQDQSLSISAAEVDSTGGAILTLEEMERVMIRRALKLSGGNRCKAAKILGVARSTLFEMLKRYRIVGPRAQESAWQSDWQAG